MRRQSGSSSWPSGSRWRALSNQGPGTVEHEDENEEWSGRLQTVTMGNLESG